MSILNVTDENLENSFQGRYEKHFNSLNLIENDILSKNEIFQISLNILNNIIIDDIIINFSNNSLKKHNIKLYYDDNINISYKIIKDISNYINNCLIDTKILNIHNIIYDIIEKEDHVLIILDFDIVEYDFEGEDFNDYQISMINDYLLIKRYYNLTPLEIEKLSKKQKRYLIYNINKRLKEEEKKIEKP